RTTESQRGGEDAQARAGERTRVLRAVSARGPGRGLTVPPERDPDLLHWRRSGPPLLRHGIPGGEAPGRAAPGRGEDLPVPRHRPDPPGRPGAEGVSRPRSD